MWVLDPGGQVLADDRGDCGHGKTFDLGLSQSGIFLAVRVLDALVQELDLLGVHEVGGAGAHGEGQHSHSVVVATHFNAVVHQRLQNNLQNSR